MQTARLLDGAHGPGPAPGGEPERLLPAARPSSPRRASPASCWRCRRARTWPATVAGSRIDLLVVDVPPSARRTWRERPRRHPADPARAAGHLPLGRHRQLVDRIVERAARTPHPRRAVAARHAASAPTASAASSSTGWCGTSRPTSSCCARTSGTSTTRSSGSSSAPPTCSKSSASASGSSPTIARRSSASTCSCARRGRTSGRARCRRARATWRRSSRR